MTIRLIVTGSRDWDEPDTIGRELLKAWQRLAIQRRDYSGLVLVHGHCPTGADAAADAWGIATRGVTVMRYHAHWDQLGRRAGPERNQRMIADGADGVLAFIRNHSRGATGCARLATAAGIPLHVYEKRG